MSPPTTVMKLAHIVGVDSDGEARKETGSTAQCTIKLSNFSTSEILKIIQCGVTSGKLLPSPPATSCAPYTMTRHRNIVEQTLTWKS